MRQYRIIKKSDKYYPQVRRKLNWFMWSAWKRIGIHTDGFGLYPSNNYEYGLNYGDCFKVLMDYEEMFMKSSIEKPEIYSLKNQAEIQYLIKNGKNPKPVYKPSKIIQ